MAQQAALSTAQLDTIRTGNFHVEQYLLIWDAPIIFQAQINQATFASSFAALTYDNVVVGAYTDIKADFVCYVGSVAGDLQNAEQTDFRIRATDAGVVADATTININQTSAALTDDWYIMVVKDVRCDTKLPRTIPGATPSANTYPRDFAISTYRALKPIVYNLQSVYIGELNADGYVDFVLAPLGLVTDADATTIASWTWDIDGLGFQVGSSSTQNITMRATAAGKYMPRVSITDDDGNAGYFTFKVFVVPADLSSIVNLSFDAAKITRDNVNGDTCAINANIANARDGRLRIDNLVDYSFVAIWWRSTQPIITSDIVFIGRFSKEVVGNSNVILQERMGVPLFNTNFQVDGVATQMSDVISRRLPILEKAVPSVFGEIKTLTPWRALVYFLTEHSTIMNVHAFKFGDTSDDYNWPRFSTGDSSALASALDIMFTINASLNYLPTGEVNVNRQAWYLNDTDRNALTVIADYTTQDMATRTGGGLWYSLSRDYIPQVGREMAGGGFYDSTTLQEQIVQAITPSVAQSRGTSLATFNRQILVADSTLAEAAAEHGQRTTDDVEARQPQTILNVDHPTAHWFQVPSDSDWFTWTIPASTNNRGVSVDNTVRWTLRQMNLDFDMVNGVPIVSGQYKLETQGGDYQALVTTPIASGVNFFSPVKPVAPVYDAFQEEPGNSLADSSASGQADEDNQNPFDEDDSKIVNKPEDPSVALATADGKTGMVWDDDNIWSVQDLLGVPSYIQATPDGILGTIRNAKYKKGSYYPRAWILTSDGTNSEVWHGEAVTHSAWTKTETDITGEYTLIRGTPGLPSQTRLHIYSPNSVDRVVATFSVNSFGAGSTWTSSGYTMDLGVAYRVNTVGNIRWGALEDQRLDGQYSTADNWSTYGRGNGLRFSIGTLLPDADDTTYNASHEYDFTVTGDGTVFKMAVQDRWVGQGFNNSGSFTVNVYAADGAGSRRSLNNAVTFAAADSAGVSPAGEPLGGFDGYMLDDKVYASIDEIIRQSTNGGSYSDVAVTASAGKYAKAILFVGNDDFLYALNSAGGGLSLYKVINGSDTNITPNDGVADGIVVSAEGLEGNSRYVGYYFALMTFGATVKLAYSSDAGVTWAFNTQVSNDAIHVALSVINGLFYIFVADAATLWVGQWSGTGTLTLVAKTAPSTTLQGVEVR